MYGWIWRHLPGSPPVRAFVAAALLAAVLLLLWFGVFPAAESLFPYVDVDVGEP